MGTQTVTEPVTHSETKLAPLYRVLIHNDDITPMGFVIHVLTEIFRLQIPKAYEIMMEAHETGVSLVIVEPLEQAEFHVDQSRSLSRARHFPLTFTIEPEV